MNGGDGESYTLCTTTRKVSRRRCKTIAVLTREGVDTASVLHVRSVVSNEKNSLRANQRAAVIITSPTD